MRIRSDGEPTRAKAMEAACAASGEKGDHKATFAEIGRRGEFTPALISFHFRSKDELYQMVGSTLLARVHERWPVDGETSSGRSCGAPPQGPHTGFTEPFL